MVQLWQLRALAKDELTMSYALQEEREELTSRSACYG